MVISTRRLAECQRVVTNDVLRRRYLLTYQLLEEVTQEGVAGHYIRVTLQVWQDGELVRESVEVAGGLGEDDGFARWAFGLVSNETAPVFPAHLADVLTDLAILSCKNTDSETKCPNTYTLHHRNTTFNSSC